MGSYVADHHDVASNLRLCIRLHADMLPDDIAACGLYVSCALRQSGPGDTMLAQGNRFFFTTFCGLPQ